jgi:hypothetical protein
MESSILAPAIVSGQVISGLLPYRQKFHCQRFSSRQFHELCFFLNFLASKGLRDDGSSSRSGAQANIEMSRSHVDLH